MGKIENYENIEDFIKAAKDQEIKTVFFTITQSTRKILLPSPDGKEMLETPQTTARMSLTGINNADKAYITHHKDVADISITEQSSQADVDKYEKDCSAGLDEATKRIQNEYPSVELKAGSCAPYGD
jgi:hypothetical protein